MVAKRLSELRRRHNYKLYQVAQGTGLTKATISRYENSKRENIGLNQLRALAKFYNVDIEYITGDSDSITLKQDEFMLLFGRLSDAGKMKVFQCGLSTAREEGII